MGHVYANIKLSNPREPSLTAVEVEALVDTGAITLCIPDHVQIQLGLTEIEKREITTADGRNLVVPYVGPIQVNFENRTSFTGALVLGDSVLMGAVPMEDMDLVINPATQRVTVNPQSPNIPHGLVK
ncbi:MAG: clan AA aspartic protease [Candidatus Aminicenantes bacterium]|nr:clan AA aspartic protease [Candidatus Aminicenantes bacterium]NIM81597.1 clan AA aspartic protease [Candidatus Aminicenantes bacterium]NIN20968.1 clan AA aspartic protease [Candidatus Aminicenantes bacterium]NIN44789.1 clan AA aspartic protease [Candidatus Aminicenantes bacterium]NIN87597.1 clan AA aspartic protease [Candidatus Aminicenantes bacterium]